MLMEKGFKPITPWQWLEQDLTLFALYCRCDGRPKLIGTVDQGLNEHCVICGESFKPRKEAKP